MARLIYALSGEGRGHSSRAMAVGNALRSRGHQVHFCCGGTAREVLNEQDESVIEVPALQHAMDGNRVQLLRTLQRNWNTIRNSASTIEKLCDIFSSYDPALIITDFEAFSARAASRLQTPILSLNHQQLVTHAQYQLPFHYWWDALLARTVIQFIAPSNPTHVLLTSFFFPPLKNPRTTTLVPPIIRSEVRHRTPVEGSHLLVYYNHGEGAEEVLHMLSSLNIPSIVYGFDVNSRDFISETVTLKSPSIEGFLTDLATSRAVISTAGFTLISEALYLGKPLMVVPNEGIFEQTLNGIFLEREGLGEMTPQPDLNADTIKRFLDRHDEYSTAMKKRSLCGNEEAIQCIEKVLHSVDAKQTSVSNASPGDY